MASADAKSSAYPTTMARRLAKLEERQTRFAHGLVPRTVDLVNPAVLREGAPTGRLERPPGRPTRDYLGGRGT